MASFEDRQKGFEAKYKNDQEKLFKITARRNKLLGLWAAGQMGLSGEAADAYAKTVVQADFEKPGHDDVVEKVLKDLTDKGLSVTDHKVRAEMARLLAEAEQQIAAQK
jgi:hypothetical protein